MSELVRGGQEWRHWTVAITGMNAKPHNPGPGYAVARCLEESPFFRGRIIGLGYDVLDPGLYVENSVETGYLLPYPSAGEEALWERLKSIHTSEGLDVVIPCLDAEIPSFQRLEPRLRELGVRVLLPSKSALRTREKDRLPELCEVIGVRHPRTQKVPGPVFFETCMEQGWEYPLVVKGPFYDAYVAVDVASAQHAYAKLVEQWGYPVLVQEFVQGQEVNLTALGDGRGGLLGSVMMAKRALTDKGKAWAGVSVVDQELEELARALVAETAWTGPLEVEALRDSEGHLYLIEVNPRFPAWIYLSKATGRNLPLALLRVLAGETELPFAEPRAGRLFVRYAQELVIDLATFEELMMSGCRGPRTFKEAV